MVVAEMSYRDVSRRFCHRREIGTVMRGERVRELSKGWNNSVGG